MTTTINASTSSGLINTADTSGILQLQTANTAALTIDASQNVGIGTSSPSYKLDVSKSATGLLARFTGLNNAVAVYTDSTLGGFSDSTGQYGLFNVYSAGSATATTIWTANAERLRVDSSGNLGLGVTPTSGWSNYRALQIGQFGLLAYNSGTPSTEIGQNYYYNGTNYIAVTSGTAARFVVNNGNDKGFAWYSAGATGGNTISFTQAMTLDASGNLLVGTTTFNPSAGTAGLSIGSTATLGGGGWGIIYGATSTASSYAAYFKNPNGAVGSILTSGSSTAFNTSSDYRLKNTITPMTGALAKVAQLKPVTYKWNADGSNGEGFIAHELAEVVPQCVSGEKDAVDAEGNPKYQGIDVSFLVATLTAAIQEQQALITQLQADVAALKGA